MGRAFGPEESEQANGGVSVSRTNDECGMTNVELPHGWANTSIKELIELNPKAQHPENLEVGFVPMPLMGKRFCERVKFEVRKWGEVKKGYTHFQDGDVLLAKITPCFENGKGGLVTGLPNGVGAGSTEYFVSRPLEGYILPEYLLAYLKTPEFMSDGATQMTGSVGHKRVPKDFLLESKIPLAPLAEQKRIVDKLEAVLRRVDACRARLDRVPALLKRFRQSVLAAAISGRLTEEWRAANPKQKPWLTVVSEKPIALPPGYKRLSKQSFKPTIIQHDATDLPDTWCVQTVNQLYSTNCLIDFADGNHGGLYPRKEEFGVDGALFLTATQMDNAWGVALDECPRLNWKKAKQLTKGWAQNDDVLLSHNATVGRVGILEGASEDVLLGTSVTFYRFNPKYILPRFGRIIFSSRFFKDQLESVMKQTTRDQVPITKQVSLNCICAPIDEQQEIVRRVEDLFAFADRIEARLATAQKTVERLTPATFAKAFRGELVPQDPNDEPASALLERLRSQPASPTTKTARKVLPVRIKH